MRSAREIALSIVCAGVFAAEMMVMTANEMQEIGAWWKNWRSEQFELSMMRQARVMNEWE
jgi:hypothetical protein